jgi:DNA invertase Pin-like site-specific DNA recombinase
MTTPVRAALYLRVSTGRQADNDLSIPDQRRQAKSYCTSRGWEIVADYVEPGVSATDDRRPEFQRMIDAATTKPPAFDLIVVHSFSRFFRDQFQLEFYVRRLAKNRVRLVSITQELGDDPMSNMIRQIMALFDEYQSKENAKHTLRAMKENARQGFWNGALPPRLPPRSPPRAHPAHRSRRERSSHHGLEKRTAAHARRRFERKNGRFWRAQFCTEVARPKRFELLTPRFVVWCSIQLSYGRVLRIAREMFPDRANPPGTRL